MKKFLKLVGCLLSLYLMAPRKILLAFFRSSSGQQVAE